MGMFALFILASSQSSRRFVAFFGWADPASSEAKESPKRETASKAAVVDDRASASRYAGWPRANRGSSVIGHLSLGAAL